MNTRAYFGFYSSTLTLSQVAETLAVEPSHGWSIGDVYFAPNGQELSRADTWWELTSAAAAGGTIQSHLDHLMGRLRSIENRRWQRVRPENSRLAVVHTAIGPTREAFELDAEWFEMLAATRASVDFDQYADELLSAEIRRRTFEMTAAVRDANDQLWTARTASVENSERFMTDLYDRLHESDYQLVDGVSLLISQHIDPSLGTPGLHLGADFVQLCQEALVGLSIRYEVF